MIAVLTGDIVSSRRAGSKWKRRLTEIIEKKTGLAKAPKWSVFRGDGFQVELEDPSSAVRIAILIRAGLKSMTSQNNIDARIGIGMGKKEYTGKSVNESTGEAYLLSGAVLDSLKDESHRLEVNTPWPDIDKNNIALKLASAIIDDWTQAEAEIAWLKLSEGKTQVEMARKLKITQPAVHKRNAGAHLNEILELITYFETAVRAAIKSSK